MTRAMDTLPLASIVAADETVAVAADKLGTSGMEKSQAAREKPVVALTGASGYVGGLLKEPLARIASELRCISRSPGSLKCLPGNATAVYGDVMDPASLRQSLEGADFAYYLVHSLSEDSDFSRLESESAKTFATIASECGIKRIIYLGALAHEDSMRESKHIESRRKVGEILRSTGVAVTEFRSSVVIGAGSMPFEAIRALVERLPLMITPRWVRMGTQPIAADDLVRYLMMAIEDTSDESHVYEIGGGDITNYAQLMRAYANERKLRRAMLPVPVVTPRLSSLWLKLVTPAHYKIGRRIVDSAAHSSVVRDHSALRDFPIKPVSMRHAIRNALASENLGLGFIDETVDENAQVEKFRAGNKFIERRRAVVSSDRRKAANVIFSVGGETGWMWGDWLWRIRGAIDRVVGGPGLRRSERGVEPQVGKTLDFWTVERYEYDRLTLRADMKLPGEAWLDLRVREADGKVTIEQTAAFDPRGVLGIAYWIALSPAHALVFGGMLRGMVRRIEQQSE